jgi:hypothetical protein
MEEKKKVSIFSLYEREKKVSFTDKSGNTVDVLFVKMTQGEITNSLEIYNKTLREQRKLIQDNNYEISDIKKMLEVLSDIEIASNVVEIESVYRKQYYDLYPVEDETEKTQEQKTKERDDIFAKWKNERLEELKKIPVEDLKKRLIDLQVESLASIRASIMLNNYCIASMAVDPETREKIFKSADEVQLVKDKSIIEKCLEIVNDFRYNINEQIVRVEAQSPNFTPAGQSQGS